MSNVVSLHKEEDGVKRVKVALLNSSARLGSAIEAISRYFDTVDRIVEMHPESMAGARHKRLIRAHRDALTNELLELQEQIDRLLQSLTA